MKEKSTRHRDAIDKVAEAVDNALVACVHRMDADDEPNLDGILMSLGEARAYIVQAKLQAHLADRMDDVIDVPHDQPRVYADEVSPTARLLHKPLDLPKLKPQGHAKVTYKPGIQKLLKGAKQFACPTCDAEANTNCFKYEGPGAHPKRTDERNDGSFHHRTRQDIAAAYNKRIKAQNILH
jgi:hypothetical protein